MKINLTVKPNSTKGPLIVSQADGSLLVYIRAIAADGQANQALIKLLAKHFKVSQSRVAITRGHGSHHKVVEIEL